MFTICQTSTYYTKLTTFRIDMAAQFYAVVLAGVLISKFSSKNDDDTRTQLLSPHKNSLYTLMTLADIEKQVEEFGVLIDTPKDLYPTYGYSVDSAHPHIEIDNDSRLHVVVVERGQELERRTTGQPDELLYWIFDSITFSMACRFELRNRVHTQDFRRILFNKQEELLGKLNVDWRLKKVENHKETLAAHPFADTLMT